MCSPGGLRDGEWLAGESPAYGTASFPRLPQLCTGSLQGGQLPNRCPWLGCWPCAWVLGVSAHKFVTEETNILAGQPGFLGGKWKKGMSAEFLKFLLKLLGKKKKAQD